MEFKKETVIGAPAEKVFSYLADLSRHSEWAAHTLKLEAQSEGAIAAGSKFKSVGHQFGSDNTDEVTIAEYVPSERLVFDSAGSSGTFRHTFELRPEGEGTNLAKSVEILSAPMKTKLLTPVLAFALPKGLTKDLQQIKSRLE